MAAKMPVSATAGCVVKCLRLVQVNGLRSFSCSTKVLTNAAAANSAVVGNGACPVHATTTQLLPFSEIPGPKGLPLLGTILDYSTGRLDYKRFHEVLMKRYQDYGPIMKEKYGKLTIVHIFEPEDIKLVYQLEGRMPLVAPLLEMSQVYRKEHNMSLGLGNLNGEEWYKLRHGVQQMMMRPQSVNTYLPKVEEVADDFLDYLDNRKNKNNEIADFLYEASRWNLETSTYRVFNLRNGYLTESGKAEADRTIQANLDMFRLSARLRFALPIYNIIPTPSYKKLVAAEDHFYGSFLAMVDETIAKIKDLESKGQLIDNKFEVLCYLMSRPELDQRDVGMIALSMSSDGLSTTVPALVFTLYQLARNPEAQELAYAEAKKALKPGEPVTVEILNHLNYIRSCVKETLRLMNIGVEISRIAPADIAVRGYHIPKGTRMELHHFVNHKNPKYFEDPEQFKPERWLRNQPVEQIDARIVQPFGHGPRMCAGRRFSEQDLHMLLSKLLLRYKVEWHGPPMGQRYSILMEPDCTATFTLLDRK